MRILVGILCLISFVSCSYKKNEQGPLSQFNAFNFMTCISPYENYDREQLYTFMLDALREVGEVIVTKYTEIPSSSPILLLSLGNYQKENSGSIQIIGDAKVVKNGFNIACRILEINYYGKNLAYPEIEDDKIIFKKKEGPLKDDNPHATIKYLISEFLKEYKKNNPNGKSLTFYVAQGQSTKNP